MKEKINQLIKKYVKDYSQKDKIKTCWKEPLIAFADAEDKKFLQLKKVISSSHALPSDFLKNSKTVITYFLPFAETVTNSNIKGKYSSRKWAQAYIETNQLISEINKFLKNQLEKRNYKTALIAATNNFDKEKLISDWSHRHAAYIAGLGKFGLNNMLITEKGCSGRVGSIITDLKLEPTPFVENENCLYKYDGSCGLCVDRCITGALKIDDFDRDKCYEILLENDQIHSDLESTTDVCGKCCVALPCSHTNPVLKNNKGSGSNSQTNP